ncbi:hypothetical protein BGZ61DRAFT_577634 [Ilyonectria robusta]|uniref:uncharacterized protein n=1 Tax=Ilyonectria robusta TaxID=1079257 RepID=UPI001E8D0BE6|nr:uncharacterized protein BGZ61DRAFT_577634 [Ilyonectria robusta]KAH8650776.1 hypothetical protein BGZ61DRAFT_577634 [Ilyonectria robusta]
MSDVPEVTYRPIAVTSKIHRAAYPAISPSRPELSQAGKTILITGGSAGIGFAIAVAFGHAAADRVIIVGRDQSKLDKSTKELAKKCHASKTVFEGLCCQLANPASIDTLWDNLDARETQVDVLVLNAAAQTDQHGKMGTLGWEKVWSAFEINVRCLHQFSERMWKQALGSRNKKYIVNVSACAIHDFPTADFSPSYALTKNSGTLLLQQLAREWHSSDIQIVSFHPGAVYTPAAEGFGLKEDSLSWDDGSLPGSVAVWAASDEAAFLHGRFIWSAWDVDELRSGKLKERLENDDKFLRIGVHGL